MKKYLIVLMVSLIACSAPSEVVSVNAEAEEVIEQQNFKYG